MTPGAQWRAKVLARRRSGRYTVLTVTAPGVADRCRPGQFASVAVAPDSGLLLRRQVWLGASSASGRDGGALELVLDPAEPGAARLADSDKGALLDVIAPLGRPFSLPREPLAAVLAGSGSAAAALLWLAAALGAQGSRFTFVHLPPAEPYGPLDARRLAADVWAPAAAEADTLLAGLAAAADVVYSAGPGTVLAGVAAAAGATPHQAALQTGLVCGAATCTACVIPVRGRDGVSRMVRACADGAVFNADLVRWDELGTIPPECHDGAPA